jgi:VIT1/CCC1 family predicted Fe2+/Mn2+ transporter
MIPLLLAAIGITDVLLFILLIIVAGLVYYIVEWAIVKCKTPEPFATIVRVAVVLLAAAVLISELLHLFGKPRLISW